MQNKKIVLITGTSSGFGMLTAIRLSKYCVVYATMRNLAKADELKQHLCSDAEVFIRELDVTKSETIEKVVHEIDEKYGKLDVLINNAGCGLAGCFEDLDEDEIRSIMDVNFFGVQDVTRRALPLLHKSKEPKIVNISSIAGRISYPVLGAYNASKWAIEGFSESLRLELLPFGIKVVLVEPGSFQTKIFEENARLCRNISNKESRYFTCTDYVVSKRKSLRKFRPNPDIVAKKIEKIVNTKHPKFRNVVGMDAKIQLYVKTVLPFCVYERILNFFAFRGHNKNS